MRKIDNEDIKVKEITVETNGTDVWEYEFDDVFLYDTNGEKIDYWLVESLPEGYENYYETNAGSITDESYDLQNILKNNSSIQLIKTGKSTSEQGEDFIELGKDIKYTFEITNTGNLPLGNITLTDELEGVSDFTYATLNDETFSGDIDKLVLQPDDVLVATATYEVSQEDVNHGQVDNHAEVVGTPTVPEPDKHSEIVKFDDTPVKDNDDAMVPAELEPKIALNKTANKETVSEVNEKITYTFEITNTGNTTLTDIILNDDMLGGNVTLDTTVLNPGESTTVTAEYDVTQADINSEEILNKADVEGTPPPAYTNNPENPNKVTDKDKEVIEAIQSSEIDLVKEADKDELVVNETINYIFTATNTGNTPLTNVKITDILEGISEIEYLTINGESIVDTDNITLDPNDVLAASATYLVTQNDVDLGQVFNEATVTGIDPKDEKVTDEDERAVPSNPELGIELVKTSDKQYITEAGEKIKYTFMVTNTSNVTLTDVRVTDKMLEDLGIDINLEETTLKPGESTTAQAIYKVTEQDIEAGNVDNIATASGTPPNPNDTPPVAEDKEVVPVAQINLDKSSQPRIYTEAGQEVTYNLVITNTGDVTLNDIILTDDMLGGDIELAVDSLEPGESTAVQVPYTVTETDVEAGEIINTAQTEGTPKDYDPENPNTPNKVKDEDNDEVLYSGIVVEKTSDKNEVEKPGEPITYTFEVKNIGKTILENVEVTDDMLADLGIKVELKETTLEPDQATTGTATYTVTQEDIDNGGVYNIATTTGTPPGYDPEDPEYPDEPPVSPPSEEEVPAKQAAEINLEKSADLDEYKQVGDEINYTFTVTNTGNVTLTDVNVEDETFKFNVIMNETTLAPGEFTTGTYTHIVTQKDLDTSKIHNFANTEGTPPAVIDPEDPDNPVAQDPVTDEDDEVVEGKQKNELSLDKKANKQEVEQAGDEITYTLTVKNTGNTTLKDVTVNDEMLGGDLLVSPSILTPGETGEVKGTYTVTQEDIDNKNEIVNIATATGTPPGGDPEDPDNPTTPPVEEEVPVENDPEITLVKQADKEELVEGETITYTFTATNTGNTTLNHVNLVDELEGISDIEYLTVNDKEIAGPKNITLLVGDVLVATAAYNVTQADVDANEVYNHATVEGTPPAKDNPEDPDNPIAQDPVTDEDDTKVPSEHKPEITLEKTTEKQVVKDVGEVITYKFVVTNTGNVTIDNPKIDDPMLGDLDIDIVLDKDRLSPGESIVAYADYTVTQEDIDNKNKIINIATATGTPPGGDPDDPDNPTTPPVEEEVPVINNSQIAIEKTADEEIITNAGETIKYNFVITNTGNTTLDNVKVQDEMLDKAGVEIKYEAENIVLSPGKSTTATATYTVTQTDIDNGIIKNIATSTGTPPGKEPEDPENPVSPPDREEVPVDQISDISLIKEANKKEVSSAGEKVEYTFTVTNTGNITLNDVKVYDETFKMDVELAETKLMPGESTTGTLSYIVTQDNIDNNGIHNIATAEGTPSNYDPDNPDSPEKPQDQDDEKVFNKKEPSISLEKTSDIEKITKIGEKIKYMFNVTNTGNTTLNKVTVNDPMLEEAGMKVDLLQTTLKPGESTKGEVIYEVTEKDFKKSELINVAMTTGTPPGYNPDDPESPQRPTDKDQDELKVEKTKPVLEPQVPEPTKPEPGDKLPKTATDIFNWMIVGLVILLTGLMINSIRRRNV